MPAKETVIQSIPSNKHKEEESRMQKSQTTALLAAATVIATGLSALAHFQILVPETDIVGPANREVSIEAIFTHPMDGGPVMDMGRPARFGVLVHGEKTDLRSSLKTLEIDGKTTYTASCTVKRPGDAS
jgi:cobalt/nickel transport protein